MRVLREEESLYCMTYFVDAVLGKKFTANTPPTIDEVF
jgi:dynein heavy chain